VLGTRREHDVEAFGLRQDAQGEADGLAVRLAPVPLAENGDRLLILDV
jgi:hypothetical protein